MNRSLEVLKAIYKPYRYTLKGKATLLETTSGDFIIKPKKKDISELYNYLISRGFDHFPKLVDASRRDVNVFEYVESIRMPKEQMCDDIIDLIASLHNKTSYFKEVSEDTYKAIYEDIKSNISYLKNYYDTLFEMGFSEVYQSPSTYQFLRNFSKLNAALDFCDKELDNWYELIKGETKTRVSVVHNNLALDHYLKGNREVLISWDDYLIDTPIIDLVKLYKKEYLNINFAECLERYMYKFPLLEYEKKLLFILITLPPELKKGDSGISQCRYNNQVIDYVFKTEDLIRPYYNTEEENS